MRTPDLSNLPLVAAVGVDSPDAKRPRPEEEEEGDPSSSFAPTAGRWWPVNDGEFRVMLAKGGRVLPILANPMMHSSRRDDNLPDMFDHRKDEYDPLTRGAYTWLKKNSERSSSPFLYGYDARERPWAVHHLWNPATLIEERSLGAGHPVAAIFLGQPNIDGYGGAYAKAGGSYSKEARNVLMNDGAFGANKTSLPPTRAPEEIHLIVNLLTPNQYDGGWTIMAIGIVPVPAGDEAAQMERLGDLMANCPYVDVDIVRGE